MEYQYLLEDSLPALVLAVKNKYNFREGREWIPIEHQTAGNACNHHYMNGSVLKPRENTLKAMHEICDSWYDSNCGVFGVVLDEIIRYRTQLRELLGVDCYLSYRNFEEAIYPIDCSVKAIRKLAFDDVPDDLNGFISWDKETDIVGGCVGRWNLYILGENSD